MPGGSGGGSGESDPGGSFSVRLGKERRVMPQGQPEGINGPPKLPEKPTPLEAARD